MPLLGMLPYIVKNKLSLQELHDKHGPRFMINTGPMSGWTLALEDKDDIRDVLSEGRPFDANWPRAHSAPATALQWSHTTPVRAYCMWTGRACAAAIVKSIAA